MTAPTANRFNDGLFISSSGFERHPQPSATPVITVPGRCEEMMTAQAGSRPRLLRHPGGHLRRRTEVVEQAALTPRLAGHTDAPAVQDEAKAERAALGRRDQAVEIHLRLDGIILSGE